MTRSYVCIDLETTGLQPKTEKIIEIGAVKVIDGQVTDTFSTFLSPGRPLETRIVELTGITDEMLVGAPRIEEVLPGLLAFVGELPLLGHNILFDYSFLKKAAVNQKLSFDKAGLDTLRIARACMPELPKKSLSCLREHFGIGGENHRALGDAMATHELYGIFCEKYGEKRELFEPKPLCYQVKRETPITKPQKERLSRLFAEHTIEWQGDVERLTRNEADRLIDMIRSGNVPGGIAK